MTTSRPQPDPRAPTAATSAAPTAARAAEVALVTADEALTRALREAAPTLSIMVAATPTALADLLLTGRCGALVLDIGALGTTAATVARHLATQFPDVPVVAVGSREDEARVAPLISAGLVYRFLHRPVSADRARTFVEAALRRHGELRGPLAAPRAPAPAARRPGRAARPMGPAVGAAAAALLAALAIGGWLLHRPQPAPPAAVARAPVVFPLAADRPAAPPAPDAAPARSMPAPAPAPAPLATARLAADPARETGSGAPAAAPERAAEPEPAPRTPLTAVPPPAEVLPAEVATASVAAPEAVPVAELGPAEPAPAVAAPRRVLAVAPEYPARARARGIEGWVDVRFTVNTRGAPERVVVTGAEPAGVFDAEAVEAVRHWRYEPPAAAADVTQRLRFQLR